MSETYDITYAGAVVGKAQQEKQGLYRRFSCRCRLPDENLYRIHVICGQNREDLGICVPVDNVFGTDKAIPAKRLGEGTPVFELLPKDWKPQRPAVIQEQPEEKSEAENERTETVETMERESEDQHQPAEEIPNVDEEAKPPEWEEEPFIAVYETEPFDDLDKLEHAVMDVRHGEVGIVLQEME